MSFLEKIAIGTMAVIGASALLYSWAKPKNAWGSVARVLVLGDSITSSPGYLPTLREGFGSGVKVKCISLSGEGTKPIKEAGLEVAQSWEPDLVIVLAGVNDLASGRGWEHAARNLDALYRGLDALGIMVAAVQLTPWASHSKGVALQEETSSLNFWISRHDIPRVVVHTERVASFRQRDGLHLTKEGGRELAGAVLDALGV